MCIGTFQCKPADQCIPDLGNIGLPSYWGMVIQFIEDRIEDDQFFANGIQEHLVEFLFNYAIGEIEEGSDAKEILKVIIVVLSKLYFYS